MKKDYNLLYLGSIKNNEEKKSINGKKSMEIKD